MSYRFSYNKKGELPDGKKKCCSDCDNLIGLVNLWCGCEDAVEYRRTARVPCTGCKFWKPMKQARWWDYINPGVIVVKLDNSAGADEMGIEAKSMLINYRFHKPKVNDGI